LKNQPNGMALDDTRNVLYVTDEGIGSSEGGTLVAVKVDTGETTLIRDQIPGADGCWFDAHTQILYVGQLLSMRVDTFDVASGTAVYVDEHTALHDSPKISMLDDITVARRGDTLASTYLFGADWTGKQVKLFRLDGSDVSTVDTGDVSLYQPTSVRWGAGPGFDPMSIYVTEGGGATKHQTKRRVLQLKVSQF